MKNTIKPKQDLLLSQPNNHLVLSHWGLGFQHINLRGHIQTIVTLSKRQWESKIEHKGELSLRKEKKDLF